MRIMNVVILLGSFMELAAVLTSAPEAGYVAFNPEMETITPGETYLLFKVMALTRDWEQPLLGLVRDDRIKL